MSLEKQQLLRDPSVEPVSEVIADGLGAANKTYIKFIDGLKQYGITLMNWRYYNDGKAWLTKGEYKWTTPRGANKIKPIFWLSIWDGFFKVSFYFNENRREEMQSLPISQTTKDTIKNSKPMGKTAKFLPLVIDVKTDKQLNDIYVLAEYRKEEI